MKNLKKKLSENANLVRSLTFIFLNHYTFYYLDYLFELTFNPYNREINMIFDGYEGVAGYVFLVQVLLYLPGILDMFLLIFLYHRTFISRDAYILQAFTIYMGQYIFSPLRLMAQAPITHPIIVGPFALYILEFSLIAYFKNANIYIRKDSFLLDYISSHYR